MGWKLRNPPEQTQSVPAKRALTDEDKQKAAWLAEVEEVKRSAIPLPWPAPPKGPDLLENIEPDPVKDRDAYVAVVRERLLRMDQ